MTAPKDAPEPNDPFEEAPATGVPAARAPGPATPHPVRVGDAIGFAFGSEGARRNLLLAGLWLLVPVVGWLAVQGWAAEAAHRLVEHHPAPVPRLALRDFFHYARRGGAPGFVELLGIGVLSIFALGLSFVANAVAITAGIAAASSLVSLLTLVLAFIVVVVVLGLVSVVWNAMLTRAELSGKLGEALAIGDAWREARPIRRRTALAYLAFMPFSLLVLAAGSALLCVGVLPAYVAVKLAGVHLRHQLYAERAYRGGKALPLSPPAVLPSERHLLRALPPGVPR
jgi:Protein of unknown function (DUF4013)